MIHQHTAFTERQCRLLGYLVLGGVFVGGLLFGWLIMHMLGC